MPWSAPKHCPVPGHPPFRERRCPACTSARKAAAEARRPSATARGYDGKWRRESGAFLLAHPRCGCGAPATLVDHKIPHKGNQHLFWSRRNWQALCTPCHGRKTVREDGGFGVSAAAIERARPTGLLPSRIPLVIVCGPSGGGKSAYVRTHAVPGDLIIDLDEIKVRLSGLPIYSAGPEWTVPALNERNRLLRSLATDQAHRRAWFIVQAPTADERAWWARTLRPERIEIVAPPLEQCVRQIQSDYRRAGRVEHFVALARRWFERFEEGAGQDLPSPPIHRPAQLAGIHTENGDS